MKLPFNRKYISLIATGSVMAILFGVASVLYDGFFSLRVLVNLFSDNAFLGIAAIGMTFVIISGGIDLSVGSVIGFSTIFVAVMIGRYSLHPAAAWGLALAIGSAFGCGMGLLIHAYRLPPFLVTLGGMFFARGMAFIVNPESLSIRHGLYASIADNCVIPLTDKAVVPATAMVLVAVFAGGVYLARYTRYGRNVYAVGGNEESALLMGLPVGRTRVMVYTLNGFCAALAGVVATWYLASGNPAMGAGVELDAIASVVIGGTLLSGGVGHVAGTLMGVLIFGTIQAALMFDGRLTSWWLRIAVGVLLLVFILLQTGLSATGRATRRR